MRGLIKEIRKIKKKKEAVSTGTCSRCIHYIGTYEANDVEACQQWTDVRQMEGTTNMKLWLSAPTEPNECGYFTER